MINSDEIISNQNKFHLWDDFNKKGYFNDISNDNFNSVQKLFETSIIEIYEIEKNNNIDNIDFINKKIESHFKKKLSEFQENSSKSNNASNLEALMKSQEEEMNIILNPSKPPEINFENKNNDEPFKENVEEMINKTIQDREKEITTIMENMPLPDSDNIQNDINSNVGNKNMELMQQIITSQIKIIELFMDIKNDNLMLLEKLNNNNQENIENYCKNIENKVDMILSDINVMKHKKSKRLKDNKL